MKYIIGKKIGMSQIFDGQGNLVPVTVVEAGPCQVLAVKDDQIRLGYLPKKDGKKYVIERCFKIEKPDKKAKDQVTVTEFAEKDPVKVVGTSKGRGFAGVVKRHNFAGGPKTHGHRHVLRRPGSIGDGGVQRVFKGKRMAGHMGDARVTIKNLEIAKVMAEKNLLMIKGAIPGAPGGIIQVIGQ